MAFSRDLTVAVVPALSRRLGRRLRVWEALAATGVRSLRMISEASGISEVLLTDLHPQALEVARTNAERIAPGRAEVRSHDARLVPSGGPFDLVDLDPYGTPAPFMEAALSALAPDGVLAVTATDMAVLAGPEREACEARYAARPLRNYLCREAGLRILIAYTARLARAKGRRVVPLLSYVHDHYVRTFLQLAPGDGRAEDPIATLPFPDYSGPPLSAQARGGPLWIGALQDLEFVSSLSPSDTSEDVRGLRTFLEVLQREATVDRLFYYEMGQVAKALHLESAPKREAALEAIRAAGWKAERTHVTPSGWRTDAPPSAVAQVLSGLAAPR